MCECECSEKYKALKERVRALEPRMGYRYLEDFEEPSPPNLVAAYDELAKAALGSWDQ